MEENIEEDLKILEHIKMGIKADTQAPNIETRDISMRKFEAIDHILSDYKRALETNEVLLKENKILKEEKEQAWEEWNNLEQGSYETEQKLKQQIEKLQKENEELKEYIAIAPNLDEMTATKYRNIQQDAYIQGRAEEQQKAEQIIYENYIPIQKVKDKIRYYQELQDNYIKKYDEINEGLQAMINVLQELLEGRK